MPSVAYLVIRDGNKWTDVFRLIAGRTVTIGRAPTSQIVIKEEQASRQHAEIFHSEGKWIVRDLESRNGTAVGSDRVTGDRTLKPGDVIHIAGTEMAFVEDLNSYSDSRSDFINQTIAGLELVEVDPTDQTKSTQPTTITHRRGQTKYIDAPLEEDSELPQVGKAATMLCRIGYELANQTTNRGIANLAINGLINGLVVDAGGILMIPAGKAMMSDSEQLEVVAWRSDIQPEYQRVSKYLAQSVMRTGEAVLAREIGDDSALGIRDSKGEISATSVICAPIRVNQAIVGLVHLYSTRPDRMLEPDDLEFTLAVAENVALALKKRYREQKLVEDLSKTRNEITQLREQLGVESEIIGGSPAMLMVHQQIGRAAPSNATVLIRGESGVGKELVARAVHFSSPRKKGPFVCLNCAALTETLLESELFGHERGAFTGATERKMGKFEAADKGTLMLDEIGEMSPAIQAKFLRVLEGHPFERVGGSKPIKADVRVIAATNRDLEKAVRENQFRKDLYFRLHVVQIEVPPLRRRPEDIIELAEYFLQKFNAATGRRIKGFSPAGLDRLKHYRWPGNVRELKNVIERAVVLAQSNSLDADELMLSHLATASESQMDFNHVAQTYQPLSLSEIERKHIHATLVSTGWNKSRSAQILGIERSTLDRKIRRHKISKPHVEEVD
jgi:transcriptional regulator with GAF, ATPase, and Fis domain